MASASVPLFKVFMPEDAAASLGPILSSGQLAAAAQVARFEGQLASWLGTRDAVAVSDASGALTLALYLAGVRPGDEVVVSPLACAATLMPIANLFARPVWADVDALTGMPSAAEVVRRITPRSRAVLHYHWSGDVGEIEAVCAAANAQGVACVEDATEAFGASLAGKRLGSFAAYTVFSFYATKLITTGEGAALLAQDASAAASMRQLRRFGINPAAKRLPTGDLDPALSIPLAGFNFPMNELAATIGLAALPHAERLLARHVENGRFYETALVGTRGLQLLQRRPDAESSYWTYSMRAERRDDLIRKLGSAGIAAQRLHVRADSYACFGAQLQDLPGVARFDAENLSIPCGWWVDAEARERIVACVKSGW